MLFRSPIALLAAALSLLTSDSGPASSGRLEVVEGEFRLRLDDGRVLASDALVGARIVIKDGGEAIRVLIDAVEEDKTAAGRPLVLYRLMIEDAAGQGAHDACQPDARGRRLGLPLLKETGITLTCTSGAEGKCILMGYRPWDDRPDVPMRDLHAACVHMVRADYGGDDHPTTRDGTTIDVYDRFGIQKPETADPMPLEAVWGTDGAICVAHTRIAGNVTLDELAQRYSTLRHHLGPEACTEEAMRHHPDLLLFNRSALTAP
jgi:ADYC domain